MATLRQSCRSRDVGLAAHMARAQVLPPDRYAPFNGVSVWSFLQRAAAPDEPLLLIGFSAGVVGAIAAGQLWQRQGHSMAALIAMDGWGVPQVGDFPLHRVSHDAFTHWSSALLGQGQAGFYADPPVSHLALWQFPERARGWRCQSPSSKGEATTAVAFIGDLLQQYSDPMGKLR